MLEVELDVFSGVPNPTWVLSPRQEATLYERLRANPKEISSAAKLSPWLGLGYRGLVVRRIKTDDGPWERALAGRRTPFPNEFRLGLGTSKRGSVADWLVRSADRQGVERKTRSPSIRPTLLMRSITRPGGPAARTISAPTRASSTIRPM